MGLNLGKAFKSVGDKLSSGAKSVLNAPLSAVEQVGTSVGTTLGGVLSPVAQSGALGQITSGAVSAFTGSPGGLLSAATGAGAGGFDLGSVLGSFLGSGSQTGSPAYAQPVPAAPVAASSKFPGWAWAAIVGGAALAFGLVFALLRRKGRR